MATITFHENSKISWDCFHIRLRADQDELGTFLAGLQAVRANDMHEVMLGAHKLSIYDMDIVEEEGAISFAHGNIGTLHWTMQVWQNETWIDFNGDKGEGDDYLDRTHDLPLHETFWIEPAAIIRTMLGKTIH